MPDGESARSSNTHGIYRDWRRISGLGCFGKPATLITMLANVMARYERSAGHAEDRFANAAAVRRAARRLILRLSEEDRAFDDLLPSGVIQPERVTGFFIYTDCGRTRIQVFTRKSEQQLPFRPG